MFICVTLSEEGDKPFVSLMALMPASILSLFWKPCGDLAESRLRRIKWAHWKSSKLLVDTGSVGFPSSLAYLQSLPFSHKAISRSTKIPIGVFRSFPNPIRIVKWTFFLKIALSSLALYAFQVFPSPHNQVSLHICILFIGCHLLENMDRLYWLTPLKNSYFSSSTTAFWHLWVFVFGFCLFLCLLAF